MKGVSPCGVVVCIVPLCACVCACMGVCVHVCKQYVCDSAHICVLVYTYILPPQTIIYRQVVQLMCIVSPFVVGTAVIHGSPKDGSCW